MKRKILVVYFAFLFFIFTSQLIAIEKNGFELDGALIPADEILSGGPQKDGIPAIDQPVFEKGSDSESLKPDSRILGVNRNGIAKAYPISILNWHEIVNDFFKEEPIVIVYCPLCGSGSAYLAKIDGETRAFGVSGLLYNSDVLLYDRLTQSLWSQLLSQSVSGKSKGKKLKSVAASNTTWRDWKKRYPNTLVLTNKTGFNRNYKRDPYTGYEKSKQVYFPVAYMDRRYHPKEIVLGLEIEGKFKAYPFVQLGKTSGRINDELSGKSFAVIFDQENRTARVIDALDKEIPTITTYWFAWIAFHKESEVYAFQQ